MSANRTDEASNYPIDIISKLCHSSIIYELLSARHNKVIHVQHKTSNKDSEFKKTTYDFSKYLRIYFLEGIFIMYNYSRLCQVLAVYEKNYMDNYYSALPDIENIHFKLLKTSVSLIV